MEDNKILAGLATLLTEKTVLADGEVDIDEHIGEREPAPSKPKESEEVEEPKETDDSDDSEEFKSPEIDIPVVLDDPFADDAMDLDLDFDDDDDDDVEIDIEVEREKAPENSPFEEKVEKEESVHQLPETAATFLDQYEIPKENARLERLGSYDVVVLGPNVALTRAQMRSLMRSGMIAMTAEDTGGLAFVYPSSKF